MLTVNVAVVAPAATVTLEGVLATAVLLLERETTAPPAGAAPLRVIVPVEDCAPPVTLAGLKLSEESVAVLFEAGPCSKIQTVGFGSLIGTTTNFFADTTYAIPFPPEGDVNVNVPLPFVGDDEIE